jgi:hypothetical protein
VWRANGYQPVRVSNHAIEYAIGKYPTITDAIGYAYQEAGHTFYVLSFPTAQKQWVYDCATQVWHERARWNGTHYEMWRAVDHCYCFGKHLVGDWSGAVVDGAVMTNIYVSSIDILTDNGLEIRRARRAPHVSTEQEWIHHRALQIDVEVGVASIPGLPMPSTNPTFFPVVNTDNVVGVLTALDNGNLNWQADPDTLAAIPGIPNMLMSDQIGATYSIYISDAGQLCIIPASGIGAARYLNDTSNANTSWELAIGDINGEPHLTFSRVAYSPNYPSTITFASFPTEFGINLSISGGRVTIVGVGNALYLNDTVTPNTSWRLVVTGSGAQPGTLVQSAIAYNAAYPVALELATNPSQWNAVISIANGQLQQVQPYPSLRDPQIMLRFSDDGGKTWSNERWISAGQQGTYKTRCRFRRLGRSRDRVYEVVVSDPIPWRIVDAYLDADPDFGPTERINKKLAKMA